MGSDVSTWSDATTDLWARVAAHPFESPNDSLDFLRRLMREQRWSESYARRAIEEYRRFCFLVAVQSESLTPSEAVDQVWHLHLTYTQDYWHNWCDGCLGTRLHHNPTRGGASQGAQFHNQYARTLALYESMFGSSPADIWPAATRRFANAGRWRWIDESQYIVIAKPTLPRIGYSRVALGAMLLLGTGVVSALPVNPLDWPAQPFLWMYAVGGLVAILMSVWQRRRIVQEGPDGAAVQGLSAHQLAVLAEGRTRLTDTVIADALESGAVRVADANGRLEVADERLASHHREVADAARNSANLQQTNELLEPLFAKTVKSLERRGLIFNGENIQGVALASAIIPLTWAAFGIVRFVVGLQRSMPVGFLALMTVFMLAVGAWFLISRPRLTRKGRVTLAAALARHERAVRAPQANRGELPIAVALAGTSVMATTAYAGYHQARVAQTAATDGGGTDHDGGADGGAGCGGGGCGGCGG